MALDDRIAELADDDAVTFPQFDECAVGVVLVNGVRVVCYDYNAVIRVLEKDMPPEDAVEYFYFNVEGGYYGPGTPVFLRTPDGDDV
jgi:hypothetical protein